MAGLQFGLTSARKCENMKEINTFVTIFCYICGVSGIIIGFVGLFSGKIDDVHALIGIAFGLLLCKEDRHIS